jgi:hypothetical protein
MRAKEQERFSRNANRYSKGSSQFGQQITSLGNRFFTQLPSLLLQNFSQKEILISMSEDLTKKFPSNHEPNLERVLDAVQGLTTRVDSLDRKIEERLYDTRPMWESLATKVDHINEGQAELQQQVRDLREESRSLKTYLRDILRRMSIFNDTLVAIQADYRDIYDRVRGLGLKTEANGQCDL